MRTDADAVVRKNLLKNRTRRHQPRRDPAGEMPAAACVLKAAVFGKGGKVRVRGTGEIFHLLIVLGMLAFIFDHQRQRRAGGVAVVIAAEETEFVRFLPLGGDASRRAALGQLRPDAVQVEPDACGQAVQHEAHGWAM